MVICSRFLTSRLWQRLQTVHVSKQEITQLRPFSIHPLSNASETQMVKEELQHQHGNDRITNLRFKYPEFLPDPNAIHRNTIREKLERQDMLARRSVINIPEFYVGSILSVRYSEKHAPEQVNNFVGICIKREGCGLRASFLLRNAIDGEGVEVLYDLYDPTIRSIECLKLEKRLDDELLYLRDAPIEYSTVPFNMEPKILPVGTPVPLNDIKVPLKPQPWFCKWEQMNMKGIQDFEVSAKRRKKAEANAKPWEKYDLMKIYRATIPEEEQEEIYTEMKSALTTQQTERKKAKRQILQLLKKPKKFS